MAVWELTLACNMRCRHCGSRAGKDRSEELSLDEMLLVADDLIRLGCERVTLSGGEPLMRKEWPELARALVNGGVAVNMISNGHLFSEAAADAGREAGMAGFAFSIDGLEQSHTHIRRVKGNWAKIMDNFRICRDKGLSAGAITTIFNTNMGELSELHDLLVQAGVDIWQLQLATPSGNLDDSRSLLIPPEAMFELVPLLAELRARPGMRVDVGDNIGYYGGYEEELRGDPVQKGDEDFAFWTGCHAGLSVVGIESNGNIKGCLSLPSAQNNVDEFVEDNVRNRSLAEIWADPDAFAYNRKFTVEQLEGFCRSCEWADLCRGGCSWGAFAHCGTRNESRYCLHRQLLEHGLKSC